MVKDRHHFLNHGLGEGVTLCRPVEAHQRHALLAVEGDLDVFETVHDVDSVPDTMV